MTTFVAQTKLTQIDCKGCGGVYAIQESYRQERQEKGGMWMCPYCRTEWGYIKSELDKAKEEVKKKDADLARERQRHDQTRAELASSERRLSAEKGQRTKLAHRIANGVCPCCNRHFQNLQRHIESKHPGFKPDSTATADE